MNLTSRPFKINECSSSLSADHMHHTHCRVRSLGRSAVVVNSEWWPFCCAIWMNVILLWNPHCTHSHRALQSKCSRTTFTYQSRERNMNEMNAGWFCRAVAGSDADSSTDMLAIVRPKLSVQPIWIGPDSQQLEPLSRSAYVVLVRLAILDGWI